MAGTAFKGEMIGPAADSSAVAVCMHTTGPHDLAVSVWQVFRTAPLTKMLLHLGLPLLHEKVPEHRAGGRRAFVTSLRSPEYLVLTKELSCSLSATNPGNPLIVLAVVNELSADVVEDVSTFAQYREVPNIEYPSKEKRFGKNRFKMHAWNMTEYEAIVMIDSDMVVLASLRHVFDLPTDFAWTYLNADNGYAYNAGGFIFLRPCASVFSHMLQILEEESKRYKSNFAEQSFFSWYFAYTGYRLPMIYNANFNFLINGTTVGPNLWWCTLLL